METTAKDFLEQYRSICKELDWIDSEFDCLEKEASQFETDSVVGSSKSEPYQPHSILISDFIPNQTAIKQMDELLKKYQEKRVDAYLWKIGAEKVLEQVNNSTDRMIIRLHFLKGLSGKMLRIGWVIGLQKTV